MKRFAVFMARTGRFALLECFECAKGVIGWPARWDGWRGYQPPAMPWKSSSLSLHGKMARCGAERSLISR